MTSHYQTFILELV